MAAADQLSSLLSLISGVQGKSSTTKTSGGTSTTQANVSDAGVNQLLNQILSGSGGVKDIGTRARASGLYNSTTEQNLLQNLYSTAANQAELARTPTVTTTAPQTQVTTTPGVGLGTTAATLGAGILGSTALNALSPLINAGANTIGSSISDLLGLNSGSDNTSGTGKSLTDLFGIDVGGSFGGGGTTSNTSISTGEGFGLNTGTLGSFNSGISGVEGAKGLTFGMDLDSGAGSTSAGGFGALGSLAGAALSGLLGGSMGGGSGSAGGSSGGNSIICTALMSRGLLNEEHYKLGQAYINSVPYEVKVGYYLWATSIAAKIKAGHKGWTKVCLPFAASRTALLATNGSFINHCKYPLGTLTKFIGEPICGVIGELSIRKALKTKSINAGV